MAFAQPTYREGLRDIEACLRSSPTKLYHMGVGGRVSKSTLADANERHDWKAFYGTSQNAVKTQIWTSTPATTAPPGSWTVPESAPEIF